MTNANDDVNEGDAPLSEQKGFAALWMQIRGSKARCERAYTRYVTEQSNAADEGDAPLSEQKG